MNEYEPNLNLGKKFDLRRHRIDMVEIDSKVYIGLEGNLDTPSDGQIRVARFSGIDRDDLVVARHIVELWNREAEFLKNF